MFAMMFAAALAHLLCLGVLPDSLGEQKDGFSANIFFGAYKYLCVDIVQIFMRPTVWL